MSFFFSSKCILTQECFAIFYWKKLKLYFRNSLLQCCPLNNVMVIFQSVFYCCSNSNVCWETTRSSFNRDSTRSLLQTFISWHWCCPRSPFLSSISFSSVISGKHTSGVRYWRRNGLYFHCIPHWEAFSNSRTERRPLRKSWTCLNL